TTWRAWASAWMRSIWWLLPSTRATQVRQCSGSRRSASSKTRLTTGAASPRRRPSATCCERARRAGRRAPRGGGAAGGVAGGGGGNGLGVVDGGDLGHALAVPLLALREPGGELGRAPRRGLGGGDAQSVRTHDHALAVAGDDENVVRLAGRPLPLLIEGVDVGRRSLDQLLQLALAQALSGTPQNRLPDVVKGAARPLQDGQSPQPVGVQLDRQGPPPAPGRAGGVAAAPPGPC